MTRKTKRWSLVVTVLTLLAAGTGYGAWTWYKDSTSLKWPEFPRNDAGKPDSAVKVDGDKVSIQDQENNDGKPQAIIKLRGDRDFGYYCGERIYVTVHVLCPQGWEPEVRSFAVKGDLEIRNLESRVEEREGVRLVRFDVTLQTVMPNGFKWQVVPSMKFLHAGKVESADFQPIKISGSPTFDGNKDAPLKHPETEFLTDNHFLVTGVMIFFGAVGVIIFPVLLMRSIFGRRKPKQPKVKALPPPDPKARARAAFARVLDTDFVSSEGLQELAMALREYFGVDQTKTPRGLLASGDRFDELLGTVLDLCEGPSIWCTREFNPGTDLDILRDYGLALLKLPEGAFDPRSRDLWLQEFDEPEVVAVAPQPVEQIERSREELERIAAAVLSGEGT
jgi:hypothetical protein